MSFSHPIFLDLTSNTIGVPSVPFGHIYHPDVGLVEERKLSKSHFKEFENLVQNYVQGYCDIPDGENQKDEDSSSHRYDDPVEVIHDPYEDDGEYHHDVHVMGVFE